MKYLLEDKPPTCLHILGQDLVDAIWAEGKELLRQNEQLKKEIIELRQTIKNIAQ